MTDPLDQINKALLYAAKKGDLQAVKKALESGANVNVSQYCPFTPGNIQVSWPSTALGLSAYYGHLQVAQYLVETGANPFLPFSGKIPIYLARIMKHEVVEKYLVAIMKRPKWLNSIDEYTGYTPLTSSILRNDSQKVKALADSGADVCKMDKHGKTPLIYAIEKSNSLEIAKILLDKGAVAAGVTAIQHALELRRNDILKCLIDTKEPIIDIFLADGCTPLTQTITTCNVEIAKYLIENGADPEKPDQNNSTLEKALEVPNVEIAEMLVVKGAKVPKSLKQSLFHQIAEDGNIGVYNFLMKNQWDVNQVDEDGKTALALSASKENLLLSRFLIENGAKIKLAQTEIEIFKKKNPDFDWCIEQIIAKRQQYRETGQE